MPLLTPSALQNQVSSVPDDKYVVMPPLLSASNKSASIMIGMFGVNASQASSNNKTKLQNQANLLHLQRFFQEAKAQGPEMNQPRIDERLCITIPCFDSATNKFEVHDPLNSCPPLGVNAWTEFEDYSVLTSQQLDEKVKHAYEFIFTSECHNHTKPKMRSEHQEHMRRSVRLLLLLSQRMTAWCQQHITRVGYNILKSPALNHNLHTIEVSVFPSVLPDTWYLGFSDDIR